jgi:lipoprotein-anchoring transpeptidase ErfK/SrfK
VVAATAGLSDLASRAEAAGIATADAGTALVHAQIYLTEPYPALLARHQGVVAELRAATDRLQQHVDVRARADDLLAKDRDLLQQVTGYGVGEELQARFDRARGALDAARLARDDAAVDAAVTELQKVDADLAAAAGGRLPLSGIACRTDAPAQLIVIHLATQQMVAYQDGCPMLRTPVTTGRAALPTGRGTFHIYYKAARYHMISPWPLGNPFYYPPTWVSNAMEFIGNGTFIHSADWQPADSYGPGSEYGPYASHGCVHVIDGPLQQLYEWAAIGTTVIVGD